MNSDFYKNLEIALAAERLNAYIGPELKQLSIVVDRFGEVRDLGLDRWIEKIRKHWPTDPAPECV